MKGVPPGLVIYFHSIFPTAICMQPDDAVMPSSPIKGTSDIH